MFITNIIKPGLLLGCILAPIAAPLTMLVIVLVAVEDLRGPEYMRGLNDYSELLGITGMFIILGAPIAYLIMILIGLPCYLIARKLRLANFWTISVGAALIPVVLMSIAFVSDGLKQSAMAEYVTPLWAIALCGFITGIVFWFSSGLATGE